MQVSFNIKSNFSNPLNQWHFKSKYVNSFLLIQREYIIVKYLQTHRYSQKSPTRNKFTLLVSWKKRSLQKLAGSLFRSFVTNYFFSPFPLSPFIVQQTGPPRITFSKRQFTIGENLVANCTTSKAHPAPHITWLINGKPVGQTQMNKQKNKQVFPVLHDSRQIKKNAAHLIIIEIINNVYEMRRKNKLLWTDERKKILSAWEFKTIQTCSVMFY